MARFKEITLKVLFPKTWVKLCLFLFSSGFLVYTFYGGKEQKGIAYIGYLLSSYTLTIFIVGIPQLYRKGKNVLNSNPISRRYINDIKVRARLSLVFSLFVNLFYAVFKLANGVYYENEWFISVAVYYFVLCTARFMLVRGVHHRFNDKTSTEFKTFEYKCCRAGGILLILSTICMAVIAVFIVFENKGYQFKGVTLYATAAFTVYRLVAALKNLNRLSKTSQPLLTAAKAIDLATALMAIFSLHTTLTAHFGNSLVFRLIINSVVACAVCFGILAIGFLITYRSQKELKKIKGL